MSNSYRDKTIIFYDGHCPLCHYWIRYAIKKDVNNQLYFAPIQGDFGKDFIYKNNLFAFDTVIFYLPEKNETFIYSKAVYELMKYLKTYNVLYYLLKLIPQILSNLVYRFIAKNRFIIYKPYDNCELPSQEVISRTIF